MKLEQIFDDIQQEVKDDISDLEEFRNWMRSVAVEQENPQTLVEREAFYQTVAEEAEVLDETSEVKQLVDTYETLEKAYEEPLQRKIEQDIEAIVSETGADLDVELERIQNRAIDRHAGEIRELHDKYQSLSESLRDSPNIVLRLFAEYVSDDPFSLASPSKEPAEKLSIYQHNHSALTAITGLLSEYRWSPTEKFPLQIKERFYQGDEVQMNIVFSKVDEIDEITSDLEEKGLSVHRGVRNTLSTELESAEVINSAFEETASNWKSVLDQINTVELGIEILSVDTEYTELATLDKQITELRNRDYSDKQELERELLRFDDWFNTWKSSLEDRVDQYKTTIQNYEDKLGEEIPAELRTEETSKEALQKDITNLIEYLSKAESWIADQEKDLQDQLSENTIDVLNRLLENEPVDLSECDDEVISELRGLLPIQLIIDEGASR